MRGAGRILFKKGEGLFNRTQEDEKQFLEEIKAKLSVELKHMSGRVSRYAQDVREQKQYMWDSKGDMDHVEKISARESADQTMRSGEVALDAKRRIEKLLQSPYFGRFDFRRDDDSFEEMPVYVGIHSFSDRENRRSVIFDWRAPICAMFYDFELGHARYRSPSGEVHGDITLKRQFRIRRGQMEFMLESGLNIMDDVLQEELSRTSDERMKNIVATIQRDQNAIIRNEDAEVLIIQGVAGSGKTSIALHRIAFLLYRFKETLSSKDVLIISPNKVFADFISNVLPELGEEQITELEMESLANELLGRRYKFQTHLEQSSMLLEGRDPNLGRRIRAKASTEFLGKLEEYVKHVEASRFCPVDLPVRDHAVPATILDVAYRKRPDLPLTQRLRWVAECAEHEAWVQWRVELTAKERAALKAAVRKMGRNAALKTLYREFYVWLGQPELFKAVRGRLEYCDVFPLIYLKLRLDREDGAYRHIKHLVVDEMQDYTPVQYAVLARLFPCNKTILGDVNQSLNAWAASTAETISELLRHCECVKLYKSYRSSYEITQFAQSISPSADLVAIERHGPKPRVLACRDESQEHDLVVQMISHFRKQDFQTMAIICKTQEGAHRLFKSIRKKGEDAHLLTARSTAFESGVVVCSVHLAKGLEFDRVLVPDASEKSYQSALDRNLLYVACTRAMHDLVLTHTGARTPFIGDEAPYEGDTQL